MLYRHLGQKQTEISALGIGAMSFSDFMANQVQKYLTLSSLHV